MHIDYGIKDKIEYCIDIILKEAKKENRVANQLLITMLSAYCNNPINLLINAPSGVGKNYVINIVSSLFPQCDILSLAAMTEKALFHRSGILVIKNENGEYEPIEDKLAYIDNEIEEKEHELLQTKNRDTKQGLRSLIIKIKQDKKELLKDAKKLIDLSNKVIIFLDTPSERLLSGLLPLLSHDKYEVEYEFVDTHNGIKTKSNVLRGWPAVVIAQALDYSKSPRFQEYQRRFITTNPTMTQEKYFEAINLIFDKSSVPDSIYQHNIVSDEEKHKAKEIIKGLKEQIQGICRDIKPGKNNVIIPFDDLIRQSIPKEKASDMTRANRLATYLLFLPLVHFDKRPRFTIVKKGSITIQTIPIAIFEDLQNTLSLMEYSDGVRPYILEWYYDVFLKAFEEKGDEKDSKINSKGENLEEEIVALTSQDIIKKHKEVYNETLTSKRLLESYLYPLFNQEYIDKIESVIDKRAKIYYPIIKTKKYINLFENEKSNNLSQQKEKIVVNSTRFISKEHIISKIRPYLRYYSDNGFYTKIKNHLDEEITLEELVEQYFGNTNDYFIIEEQSSNDNTETTTTTPTEQEKNNSDKKGFAEEYLKSGQNLEQSQQNQIKDIEITTNSEKQDKKLFVSGEKNKIIYSSSPESGFSLDYLDTEQRKKIEEYLNNGKILRCHHKNCLQAEFSTLYDYNMHCHNKHPGQPLHPELSLIKMLGLEAKGNPWE